MSTAIAPRRHLTAQDRSGQWSSRLCRPGILSTLLATLLASAAGAAEEPTPLRTFRSIESETHRGAPSTTVGTLLQGDRGLLWLLTPSELLVFDGSTFEAPPTGPAAPLAGQINQISRRQAGGLNVSHGRGVSLWDGESWTLLPIDGGALAAAESSAGILWAINGVGELLYRDPVASAWVRPPGAPLANGLVGSSEHGLWTWWDGVFYQPGSGQVVPKPAVELQGESISAVTVDPSGRLWVGTSNGSILSIGAAESSWRQTWPVGCELTFARDLEVDDQGRLWIGDNSGTICFGDDVQGWTIWGSQNGLKRAGILAMLFDREGSLWIGYNGNGLQQWIAPQWSHRDRWSDDELHPGQAAIAGIAGDGSQGFLAAVFARGVWHWDGTELHRYGAGDGLTQDTFSVFAPQPGAIWVGTRFGVYERMGSRFVATLTIPNGFVAAFFRSPHGVDYATTTHHGVFRRTGAGWQPDEAINVQLLDPDVRIMLWRASGELWVGTRKGVTVFNGSAIRHLHAGTGRMPSAVTDMIEVSPSELWISGIGGVRVVGDEDRFLTEADGMPGPLVSAMALAPSGTIWLTGSRGVSRVDRQGRVSRWDAGNGLIDATGVIGSLWIDPEENVYVGTHGALSRFAAHERELTPPALQPFWKNGPGVAAGVSVGGDRTGRWSWSAPSLLPVPVEYRIRAPGILDGWSPPQTEPRLTLPNLPSGRWSLEVAARRAGAKVWSAPLQTTFRVPPRPWETLWARAGSGLSALLLIAAVVRLRTRHHRVRAAELDRQVTARTMDLVQAHERLEEANGTLARLARSDGLTGLANRAAFDETLAQEWERARRSGDRVALILGDVDHFKLYNDHYGHQAGDQCLQLVASVLQESAHRPTDLAARYGGEEFVLLLSATDLAGAARIAERLVEGIAARRLPHAASPVAPHVTMSLGVAASSPFEMASPADLIAAADRALYEAKESGRNRWLASSETADHNSGVGPQRKPRPLGLVITTVDVLMATPHHLAAEAAEAPEAAEVAMAQ